MTTVSVELSSFPAYSQIFEAVETVESDDAKTWLRGLIELPITTASDGVAAPSTDECLLSRCQAAATLLNAVRVNFMGALEIGDAELDSSAKELLQGREFSTPLEKLEAGRNLLEGEIQI